MSTEKSTGLSWKNTFIAIFLIFIGIFFGWLIFSSSPTQSSFSFNELVSLNISSFHLVAKQPFVKTMITKYRPAGRTVDLSPLAVDFSKFVLSHVKDPVGAICPSTRTFVKSLQACMRRLLTTDPSSLPMHTLYSCRHFYASYAYMWKLGVSSAWLMSQLSHKNWFTTCIYVHTVDDSVPHWRDAFVGDPSHPFLPASASQVPVLQEPGHTSNFLRASRKRRLEELEEYHGLAKDMAEACLEGFF